jgi:hypothetical protein
MNAQVTVTRRKTLLGATTLVTASALASEAPSRLASSSANAEAPNVPAAGSPYTFERGFPIPETAQRLYDEADLNRAIQTYRFFYPNISMAGFAAGFEIFGPIDNKTFVIMEGTPKQILFTPNSDTPYAAIPLDLKAGPITIELPAGPLIGVLNDFNFRWVMDIGVPGPDEGKGGKHIILPPDWKAEVPAGYFRGQSTTYRVFLVLRSLPLGGRCQGRYCTHPDGQDSTVEPACRLVGADLDKCHREEFRRRTGAVGEDA